MSVPAFKSLASIIFTNCNYFIETIELFSGYWFVIIIFFFGPHPLHTPHSPLCNSTPRNTNGIEHGSIVNLFLSHFGYFITLLIHSFIVSADDRGGRGTLLFTDANSSATKDKKPQPTTKRWLHQAAGFKSGQKKFQLMKMRTG